MALNCPDDVGARMSTPIFFAALKCSSPHYCSPSIIILLRKIIS